jgi:hypothetical protein
MLQWGERKKYLINKNILEKKRNIIELKRTMWAEFEINEIEKLVFN